MRFEPHLLHRLRSSEAGASLTEYALLAGLIAVVSISSVSTLGIHVDESFKTASGALDSALADAETTAISKPRSCQDHFDEGERSDGIFRISNGVGEISVACHFEDTGPLRGGWAAVALQYETSPQVDWAAGVSPNRSGATYLDSSFALNSDQIPFSSSFGVGRLVGGNFEILEAVDQEYGAGNMNISGAAGLRDPGTLYDIHRDASNYFYDHDPEAAQPSNPDFNDTLTFDVRSGPGNGFTWSFSPNAPIEQRGYSYGGVELWQTRQDYAWVVFVR